MLKINLIGPMSVRSTSGQDLTPRSRKAQAILAVLCLSRDGMRRRKWLQDLLWSDRGEAQGAGSLRTCLAEIRRCLGSQRDILVSDKQIVRLDLSQVRIDLEDMSTAAWQGAAKNQSELLEGFDVRDPQFEDWLRAQRSGYQDHIASKATLPAQTKSREPSIEPPHGPEQNWALAVAVLPLLNRTDDTELKFVAEGLSEDLIHRLQRIRWLPVISKSSSFASAEHGFQNQKEFASTLGALYCVDGSLIPGKRGMIVQFRLLETLTGRVIWSDSFELVSLIEDHLNDVLNHVAGQIGRNVERTYQRRLLSQPAQQMDYLDHVWRGRWHLGLFTKHDAAIAHDHLKQALEIQPNEPEALIQMGYWHLWRAWVTRDTGEDFRGHVARHARTAAAIDPDDGRCFAMLGTLSFWGGHRTEAEALFRQSIDLTPSLALAHQQFGTFLNFNDRPDEAVAPLRNALRYSPRDHKEFGFQTELAAALLRVGELEEAWRRATLGVSRKPRYWYAHLIRMLVAHKLGDARRLSEARERMLAASVRPSLEHLNWLPLGQSEFREELVSTINQNF